MADHSEHKRRTVEGVQLESLKHGVWRVVTDPTKVFQQHRPVQMGLPSRRYTLQRWSAPHTGPMVDTPGRFPPPTYKSLKAAVVAWKVWVERSK